MPSERIQRQIDRLLDDAESAIGAGDWARAADLTRRALTLDPDSSDARDLLGAAERGLRSDAASSGDASDGALAAAPPTVRGEPAPGGEPLPASFAGGRYMVRRFLGEGGKKQVYLAHDSLLDREVALALLKTDGLDAAGRARLRHEAQAMARLGPHPHLVTVFDLGEEQGRPFLVSEFLPGGDLAQALAAAPDHRLPLDRLLAIGRDVCQGLAFAHTHGIIHRDLKPDNIGFTANGTAKIVDFGLAVTRDLTRLTQEGLLVGTVAYLAPEQALGGAVSARADLYALGATLYELLTGRPPFAGDDAVAVLSQHLHTTPVAPGWHRPDCPPALERLILALLAKDPDQRPASAEAVALALADVTLPDAAAGTTKRDRLPAATDAPAPVYRQAFVGREGEQHALRAAFDAAVAGQGSLALVVGEPGIGKTALCAQLDTYVRLRGGRTLTGHCYEEGSLSLPYLPFVEALRAHALAQEPERLRRELGEGAADVARVVPEVGARLGVAPRPPTDAEQDRYRLFQAVSDGLRAAATAQPLALVLEDLHDADRGTLDLLRHLVRALPGSRLLVIATYRDVEVDRAHPLAGALAALRRGGSVQRLALRGLVPDEVQRMLADLSGQAVPRPLVELVHRQTEGNPLFVQEVLRYLVESGAIKREDGRWRAASGELPLAQQIPEGLRDVVGRRLARLSEVCNRVLAVAAVIGREFDLATLRAVAGLAEEALDGALEEAVRIAVLEERERPGAVRYRFTHTFFRQALYEELIAPRRLRLHQQVARALEAQYAARLAEHAAELAEHYAHSTDPADLLKAVAYGRLAAERAMAVYASGEAARLLEQAVAVHEVAAPDAAGDHCDLLLAWAEALTDAGEGRRALDAVLPAALALAEAAADAERAVRVSVAALMALLNSEANPVLTTEEAYQWALRANRYARDGTAGRVLADTVLGSVRCHRGEIAAGVYLLDRAIAQARRLGDTRVLGFAIGGWLTPCLVPARPGPALALAEELYSLWCEQPADRIVALYLWETAHVLFVGGQRDRAAAVWRDMSTLAERSSNMTHLVGTELIRGMQSLWAGQWQEAEAKAERALSLAEAGGIRQFGYTCYVVLMFRIFIERGDLAAIDRIVARALATRVLIAAYLGRGDEAQAIIDARIAAQASNTDLYISDYPCFEAALVIGHREAVAWFRARVTPTVPALPSLNVYPVCTARLLALAAVLFDEWEPACTWYAQAVRDAETIGHRPEAARARLGLAGVLADHFPDEMDEARRLLTVCLPEFEDIGMTVALAEARALAARILPPPAVAESSSTVAEPQAAASAAADSRPAVAASPLESGSADGERDGPAATAPDAGRPMSEPVMPAGLLLSAERRLVTVLFTDIVGSTERAVALGDRAWRRLKARHHALVRAELARYGGHEVDTAGDGFFVTFTSPGPAIACARAITQAVRALDLEVRAGLHAGEVEWQEGGVSGLAVHTGARVAALSGAGEVLVTQTVRDLVAGAGLTFVDRGLQTLKGLPGEWRLFALDQSA